MRPWISGLLIVVAALFGPSRAAACDCIPPGFTTFLAPTDGARDVPTNTLVWVGGAVFGFEVPLEQAQVVLTTSQGSVVQGTTSVLRGGMHALVVFRPGITLEAGSTYVVSANGERLGSFTVGSAPDETKPSVPTVESQEEHVDGPGSGVSSCGESNWARLTLTHDGLFALALRDGDSVFDETKPSGNATDFAFDNKTITIGNLGCSSNWSEAAAGASTNVRLGAFDIAGNFSGFSDKRLVDLPYFGCGCASAGPLAMGLFGLLALGLRRRR